MAETGSASRTGDYTAVHKCSGCGKAFWAKPTWNRVSVSCPHCRHNN